MLELTITHADDMADDERDTLKRSQSGRRHWVKLFGKPTSNGSGFGPNAARHVWLVEAEWEDDAGGTLRTTCTTAQLGAVLRKVGARVATYKRAPGEHNFFPLGVGPDGKLQRK